MSNLDTLIISAGYSGRMKGFKPLMNYEGMPFLLSIILKAGPVSGKIIVVTGYRSEDVQEEIGLWLHRVPNQHWLELTGTTTEQWQNLPNKIEYIYNPEYDNGMFGSLQTGLKQLRKTEWVLYHFVDQPHIPASFYRQFASQLSPEFDWVQPQFNGKNGHPILIRNSIISSIITADPANDLRTISEQMTIQRKFWDCRYSQILEDFDTEWDLHHMGDFNDHLG